MLLNSVLSLDPPLKLGLREKKGFGAVSSPSRPGTVRSSLTPPEAGDAGSSSAVVVADVLCSMLKSGMLSLRGVSMKPETLRVASSGLLGLLGLLGGSKCNEGGLQFV